MDIRHSREVFKSIGAKPIWPPRKLNKKHVRHNGLEEDGFKEGRTRLLVAALYIPQEHQYVRTITDDYMLGCIKGGIYAADYYELTERQVKKLEEVANVV